MSGANVTEAHDEPSRAIVAAVADAEGWESIDDHEPLYERIDPDALDALIASMTDGRVTFSYQGYEVTVDADGRVRLAD
jgi:hypothetical protein